MRHDRDAKPGVSNLIEIHGAVTGPDDRRGRAGVRRGGYGQFKVAVADAVVEYLRPVQERYEQLTADPAEVDRLLAIGADNAAAIADPVLARATKAAGLLPRAEKR